MTSENSSSKSNTSTNNNSPKDATRRKLMIGAAASGVALAGAAPSVFAQTGNGKAQQTEGEFSGKTAFITGGARGIGLACAKEFARHGANVVIFDVAEQIDSVMYPLASLSDLDTAKKEIEWLGANCLAIQGDVRSREAQEKAVKQTVNRFGSVDFLVANAGVTHVGQLEAFDEASTDTVIDINLGGVIKSAQAVLPVMKKQKSGRIVIMASVTGRMGSAQFPIYSSTKWGVIGLAKSIALAAGKENITCNAVCPTIVHTKLLDNDYVLKNMVPQNPSWDALDGFIKKVFHVLPVGGYDTSHVAGSVKFLCSEQAGLISGEVIDIGAGANARFNA